MISYLIYLRRNLESNKWPHFINWKELVACVFCTQAYALLNIFYLCFFNLNIFSIFIMVIHFKLILQVLYINVLIHSNMSFPGGSDGQKSACSAGDLSLIFRLGRSLGEGNGYPLQYSCLENSMDRGSWQATAHRVAKSWTWLRIISLTHSNIPRYIRDS